MHTEHGAREPSGTARSAIGFLRACAFACCLTLVSCGGGGSGSTSGPPLPPVAIATAGVMQGQAPLTVTFSASGSTDPQGYALSYAWTFSDGGNATGVTVSHTFQDHGSYTATVAVSDGHNTTTSSPLSITVTAAPPQVQATSMNVDVLGAAPSSSQGTVIATDRESLPLTYTLATMPALGTASVNASTGAITYTIPGFASAASDRFTVSVSNGLTSATDTVSVALNSDPLLPNQWDIQNTGQNAFSSTPPTAGNDMDVASAWASGFTGKGIKVGVVDSGLQVAHEDLAANVDLTHSLNFVTGTDDPSPDPSIAGFDHGTEVAGIIGAVAFNGKGGRGIAYNATLRGYNLLAPGLTFSVANMATALGSAPVSVDNDLFNASFSISSDSNALPSFSGAFQAITQTAMTLRGGLGAAIVNAAGNDFGDFEGNSSPYCAQYAQVYGVSCGDPASDERRGGYYPIVVGAINANGVHSSYSSTGSALWISAPGGEYGLSAAYAPGLAAVNYEPAILTTSRGGCANAEYPPASFPNGVNELDSNGADPLAPTCQYTATMNGTSAATPNVTGTIALMLQANPKLSVRDIKYILAKTAVRVDPSFPGVSSTTIVPGSTVVLEQGWTTNAAGYTFSNRYGFGAVDTGAAVAMAKAYTTYLPPVQDSTGNYTFVAAPPAVIPAGTTTGGYINYNVSEPFSTVEFAVVFVNIATTPGLPCNQIELTSPSGTKSILLHAANGFTNSALADTRFESNAFYGEPINGTWTLRFLDFCPGAATATTLSTTQPQTLLFAGH